MSWVSKAPGNPLNVKKHLKKVPTEFYFKAFSELILKYKKMLRSFLRENVIGLFYVKNFFQKSCHYQDIDYIATISYS